MKSILVELWFDDEFTPPNDCDAPSEENNWNCGVGFSCPFYDWDDEFGGGCNYNGPHTESGCPLKQYFIKEE